MSTIDITIDRVSELRELVDRGNRRARRLILMEAAGLGFAAVMGYLWLVFLLDDVLHLALWGRLLASGLLCASVIGAALNLWRSWKRAQFSEDQIALAIESHNPERLQNRLINAIQLGRGGDASAVETRRAVVEENYHYLKRLELEQSARSLPAIVRVCAAGALAIVGLVFWGLGGERFTRAAARIFLPFADVTPAYRTVLHITPGNVTASVGDDVPVTVDIEGRLPGELMLLIRNDEKRTTLAIPVSDRRVVHTFTSVSATLSYAVRGGDFMSPYYTIDVPTPFHVQRATAVLHLPDYTRQPAREIDITRGDLQALRDSRLELTATFNQPVDAAWLLVARSFAGVPGAETTRVDRIDMPADAGTGAFRAELTLDPSLVSYRFEVATHKGERLQTPAANISVTADLSPEMRMDGIKHEQEVMLDGVLPLRLRVTDDYGLAGVGLFYHVIDRTTAAATAATAAPAAAVDEGSNGWQTVATWDVPEAGLEFTREHPLAVGLANVVEGQQLELALRARDTDPAKGDRWLPGPAVTVTVTSPGAELQILYERILQTERSLRGLIDGHRALIAQASAWAAKFDPLSGLRWDDQKNLDDLAAAMKALARDQSALRETAAREAQGMAAEAGDQLRLSVGMLADTEMVRSIRILEKVPGFETPQDKRGAVADARLTQERIVRSLETVMEKYVAFRQDWELAHMIGFTEMLAKRQSSMADAALSYAGLPAGDGTASRGAMARRQEKMAELTGLAQTAFGGMATRQDAAGPTLIAAFGAAATALAGDDLKTPMTAAVAALNQSDWPTAAARQYEAASRLREIYAALRKAQVVAARQALEALEKLAQSDTKAQGELEKLKPGTNENLIAWQKDLSLEEIIHMHRMAEEAKKKHDVDRTKMIEDYMFTDEDLKSVVVPNYAIVDVNTLKLGDKPTAGGKDYPNSSDREPNASVTSIQEKFEDLVGDLLEEADELRKDYETYNINSSWGCADPGVVGKEAGDINGTGATSTTGNMKPPTINVGGASRSGRLGARAHGLVVGDESINRRGRDEAQEGDQELADQAGELNQTMSDDPQKDTSTGIGGKLIKSDDTSFSTKDAGEWDDKIVDKLRDPQKVNKIVERKGKPLDAEVGARMVDLNSRQEQVIERIKALKKELNQLYLPTDHLDEIASRLQFNLDRLQAAPDADVFRQQMQALDQLTATVVVFNPPTSEYEQSLQQTQIIRGRILDEPATPAIPGYEDAVSTYYKSLSGLRSPRL